MNIIYIAYSCDPYSGSEDKTGWNIPYYNLSGNRVFVITKEEQREHIETFRGENNDDRISVYYVDIPNVYKKLFKKGFFYSPRLNIWHRRAVKLARQICLSEKIDIIHQITPLEFRSIGNYGNIKNVKFVCGPLGGAECVPKGLEKYKKRNLKVEIIRGIYNRFSYISMALTRKMRKCNYLFFANEETRQYLLPLVKDIPYTIMSDAGIKEDEIKQG